MIGVPGEFKLGRLGRLEGEWESNGLGRCLQCLTEYTCHGIMLRFCCAENNPSFRLLTPLLCCSS